MGSHAFGDQHDSNQNQKAQGEHLTLSQLTELDIQIAIASQLNIWHEANSQELSVRPNIIEKIDHLAKEINQETLQLLNINNLTQLLSPWINNLSDKYQVFHGDPNPTNMILLPSGTVHLIDWSTAGIGEPWVDYAMVGQYMPAAARHSWYNLITEHQGNAETKKTFQAYHYLLHLHCCFWALKQATNILNNNTQKLIDNQLAKSGNVIDAVDDLADAGKLASELATKSGKILKGDLSRQMELDDRYHELIMPDYKRSVRDRPRAEQPRNVVTAPDDFTGVNLNLAARAIKQNLGSQPEVVPNAGGDGRGRSNHKINVGLKRDTKVDGESVFTDLTEVHPLIQQLLSHEEMKKRRVS